MKLSRKVRIDWRLILFVLLLVLLPFILFSAPDQGRSQQFGAAALTDPAFVVTTAPDTLKESFPAVFSSLTIALASIPEDTVYIIANPGDQLNIAGGYGLFDTLMFTPYPAALTPQEIKVKPWNDAVYEGYHTGTITFSIVTDDAAYAGLSIPDAIYTIEDNDLPPGINTLFITDTILSEGLAGVDMLFSMGSIPADSVYITIDPDDQLRITGVPGEPVTLVFAPDASSLNYDGVSIRAVDDDIFEGPHIGQVTFTVTSADAVYAAFLIDALTYGITDNDNLPDIIINIPADTFFTEGLAGVDLLFALASVPTDSVYITIDPDDQLRITGIPGEAVTVVYAPNASALNFNGASIRAVDDVLYEGPHTGSVSFSVSSGDAAYAALTIPAVAFPIVDNDSTPGINYTEPTLTELEEGIGEVPVVIALNSVPSDTVFINVIPDAQLRITEPGVPVTLVFPPNTSALNDHIANVKAYDDYIFEGTHSGTVSFEIVTTDADYSTYSIAPFDITILDNDVAPGIVFSDTSGFSGTEGDSLLQFTVRFLSAPLTTITMTITPDMNLDLGKGPGDEVKLKFKSDSALIEKVVDVFITDDFVVEGDHVGYITFTLTGDDTMYTTMTIPDLRVAITDNDVLAIFDTDMEIFKIFPSPAQDHISFSVPVSSDLFLYHENGQLISSWLSAPSSGSLDISSWLPGAYFGMVYYNGVYYTFPFIKVH